MKFTIVNLKGIYVFLQFLEHLIIALIILNGEVMRNI